jgi:hypothetical protein
MRYLVLALLALLIFTGLNGCAASDATPITKSILIPNHGPMPLIVWVHHSIWNNYTFGLQNVMGLLTTGTPRFVLYRDGQVIYWDEEINQYMEVMLTQDELSNLVARLPLADFLRLDTQIIATNATDADSDTIVIWNEGNPHRVNVYGANMRAGENQTPTTFREILDFVGVYTHLDAEPWQAEQMEILFNRQNSNDKSDIDWPADWPIPENCTYGSCVIPLDISYYEQIHVWTEEYYVNTDILTVRMSDTVWQIFYRFVFPHEDLWLNP